MSRLTPFNNPYMLGFEDIEKLLTHIAKSGGDGYPPYNIEQLADGEIRISLAVAGFSANELSVYIEDSQLVIQGKQQVNEAATYIHRGIAARQFLRKFVLATGMEVSDSFLENGLLHIDLKRPQLNESRYEIPVRDLGQK